MDASLLKANCDQCAALCCFALAFDVSDAFPVNKPNGVVCAHLGEGNHCKIYNDREQQGYRGCIEAMTATGQGSESPKHQKCLAAGAGGRILPCCGT